MLVAWLMLHGFLDVAVILVVMGVLALLGLAVWRWRVGHRRWAAVLVAGAVAVVAVVGWYGYSLNEKIAAIPHIDTSVLGTNEDQRPAQEPTKAVNILLMGADNPTSGWSRSRPSPRCSRTASGTPAPTAATR